MNKSSHAKQFLLPGCGHRDLHCLFVAHFAEQNHVRAFAQCTAQSGDVARAIAADLTLAHNALIVAMDVLHRIFERQNMSRARTVDLVDDTRERCGLTAAR